ncbi:gluconate 2-dehydrogenase subunit 3 family protein [Sphingobium algorifonticola]|uniref:Gluconate 2-dehydrogenase subunit 3 family protein n=1 Tax=Sphingobium algorifonticola TaxID=2008318 RepID=A0A437J479_9SPHN|nr:gluconate 2-dehydrogenase subunit 3 family protein [Sphingobium algorifonticola]RVT39425.1 gluconate 2-dehydrogenase subunit 3 family protein [Sphingobium algorifonticola]
MTHHSEGFDLDRRSALAGMIALFGIGLHPALARAAAAGADPGFSASRSLFTPTQRNTVALLSERIVPTTDTPGAIAAGVPAYIEMMVADWYDGEDATTFLSDVDAFDALANTRYGASLERLPAQRLDALLTAAMEGTAPGLSSRAFDHLKQLVLTGYYTSEVGVTQERLYVPVPGESDGRYPYAKAGRIIVTNLNFL